ncbi:hypothetical protein [Lysobacter sp. A3-1-A15]|uniref:hypothetical protein n=1 Tax=Novilysobacter viscosus TaxID=3098602 RepID=UPI002ED80A40
MSAVIESRLRPLPLMAHQTLRATQFGIQARNRHGFRTWNVIEPELGSQWQAAHAAGTGLDWLEAAEPVYAAWRDALPGDANPGFPHRD